MQAGDPRRAYFRTPATGQFTIPNTLSWTLCGYSIAADRTGFYCKELDLLFDAGPQHLGKPATVLVTHGHGDHVASLPFTLIMHNADDQAPGAKCTTVFAPEPTVPFLHKYVTSLFSVNACAQINTVVGTTFTGVTAGERIRHTCNGTRLCIEVLRCHHSVPTVSYGLSVVTDGLKKEYEGLHGKKLGSLRREGVTITQERVKPRLAYVCDTGIKVFELNPTLLDYPAIIIECTFYDASDRERAAKTRHIHWQDLRPVVEANPQTHFVLVHASARVSGGFSDTPVGLDNVTIWI